MFNNLKLCLLALPILLLSSTLTFASNFHSGACTKTSELLKSSCSFSVQDDFYKTLADCTNFSEKSDRRECKHEARTNRREANKECKNVFRARKQLCNSTNEDPYDPEFGEEFAHNFVDPLEIGNSVTPNPYFPLVNGNEWVYKAEGIDEDGEPFTETIAVTVTDKTKLIDGITCLVVKDIVFINDELVEDTDDWYAQDQQGNVWYCGEIAENYETFEGDNPNNAELTDVDGSWKAGRDGAKAGISLPGYAVIGETFRQEVLWREAEDVIEILSTSGTETTPIANCNGDCLVTRDFTPLDPGIEELKYYLPGLGKIVEINLDTGERVELIEFKHTLITNTSLFGSGK